MPEQRHIVRALNVTATVADEARARDLLARIEELWRERAPEVFARVFDEHVAPDRHVRLRRLELDLGTLPADGFEAAALEALERALRDVLPVAIADVAGSADPEARDVSAAQSQAELLEYYLLHGTVPFWAQGQAMALPALLQSLAATQPAALVGVLRRIARDRRALERLVLQAGEEELRRLLALLAPADAALILTYMAELVLVHRVKPLAPLEEPGLKRLFWVVTFEYLLREAGTQFNRRSYLAQLLMGMAQSEDVPYEELLLLLRDALEQAERRVTLQSSLPATLKELLADEDLPAHGDAARVPGEADAPQEAPPADGEEDAANLHHRAGDRRALAELARAMSAASFARMVGQVEPAQAPIITAMIDALLALQRQAPFLALSDAGFERLLRSSVLGRLARGARLDAREQLEALLQDIAAEDGMPYERLVASLALARGAMPPAVAALLAALADEDAVRAQAARTDRPQAPGGMLEEMEEAFRRGSGQPARLAQLIRLLAAQTPQALAALVRRLARERSTLHRVVTMLAEEDLQVLLRVLDAEHAGEVIAYLETLREAHKAEPLLPLSETRFAQITWTLALDYVAREPGSQFNRRSLLRSLIDGIAAHDGLDAGMVMAALARGLDMLRARRVPVGSMPAVLAELLRETPPQPVWSDALREAEYFLRNGRPADAGQRLAHLAARDPAGFAALLRKLAAADAALWPERLERLLQWLTPEEVAALLLPGRETAAGRAAQALAQALRLTAGEAWRRALTALALESATEGAVDDMASGILAALLRAEGADPMAAGAARAILGALLRGEEIAAADIAAMGRRLDRDALLAHWLDHGWLPWWAPAGLEPAALAQDLAQWPVPALYALFLSEDEEQLVARLWRVVNLLGETTGRALLLRLAPWSTDRADPLQALMQEQSAPGQLALLLRVAAAGVTGRPLDLTALTRPVAPPRDAARGTAPQGAADRAALLAWLAGTAPADQPAAEKERLARLFTELADADDPALLAMLREGWRDAALRARWIAALPDRVLARLLYIVAPDQARFMLDTATLLTTAWRQTAPAGRRAGRLPWALMFDLLADGRTATAPAARALTRGLVQGMSGDDAAAATRLLARAQFLAREAGAAELMAVLQPPRAAARRTPASAVAPGRARTPSSPIGGKKRFGFDGESEEPPAGDPLYVRNAGLVLFNPFLPRFFEMLDVLRERADGKTRVTTVEAATRVVHLLQYLVDERLDTPEPDLVLNKLIAGLDTTLPVAPSYEASEKERELCAQMTAAVIANWTAIQNSSPAALRETFLQREGKLLRNEAGRALTVQRKTVDVLTDQIPWTFSVVYHRWMEHPVHVTW